MKPRTLHGKGLMSLGKMRVEGEAVVTTEPITFLGFLDSETGQVTKKGSELDGVSIAGKVFVFPRGVGSTVGPYVLVNLARNGLAPTAMINRESDSGTVAGASVAGIPLVYRLEEDPITFIRTGDHVIISLNNGDAEVTVE